MEMVNQGWKFEEAVDGPAILKKIEAAGRTCYKSEDKITDESAAVFVRGIIKSGHHSVIEHHNITVRIVTDRGVTHEIVRHRLASYSQESTRYCNYGAIDIKFIAPVDFELNEGDLSLLAIIEEHYKRCIVGGRSPQQARYFLPNGLKTEIVMTANIREWRHFFTLRASPKAHPQMRALAWDMLKGFRIAIPVLFDDVHPEVL
jgi:thymidylate synthase (FAD)